MTFPWRRQNDADASGRGELEFDFDRDGKTAAGAEGFLRDFEDGGGLLTLVLAALDEGEDAADEGKVDGYLPSHRR